jgi:hypothetical protein
MAPAINPDAAVRGDMDAIGIIVAGTFVGAAPDLAICIGEFSATG